MRVKYRDEPCRTALNRVRGMGFRWSLNPYMGCVHRCTFCYVRGFERRADRPSDGRYGTSIRVKSNIADVLRFELGRRSWKREQVVVGGATDPYQPGEGVYRLTRGCVEALGNARTPFTLLTRGPLIVRDLEVLAFASTRAAVSVNISIPTVDLEVWRHTEPGTAPPAQRLRALRMLVDAGIDAGVSMAPILPGLSDRPEQLAAVLQSARDAGATHAWCALLNLRVGTREHFLAELAKTWPELVPQYETWYAAPYLPPDRTGPFQSRFDAIKAEAGIADRRLVRLQPPPLPEQLALFAS